jgi:hypothetical protein
LGGRGGAEIMNEKAEINIRDIMDVLGLFRRHIWPLEFEFAP